MMALEEVMNAHRSAEDTTREYAHEFARLGSGLGELGFEPRPGPLFGCEVDTALAELRKLVAGIKDSDITIPPGANPVDVVLNGLREFKAAYEKWMAKAEELDRVVSPLIRLLRAEGYIKP
jgi:hypothetical protein